MQFTINPQTFKRAFAKANSLRGVKGSPGAAYLMLDASHGDVSLVSMAMKVRLAVSLDGSSISGDAERCLLDRERIGRVLDSAGDKPMELASLAKVGDGKKTKYEVCKSSEANMLGVTLATGTMQLAWQKPTDYPDVYPKPKDEKRTSIRIDAGDFRRLINQTLFAVDNESTRFALGGNKIDVIDGMARFVATDGRRLAVSMAPCVIECDESQGNTFDVGLVPSQVMTIARKLAESGDVVIVSDGSIMELRGEDWTLNFAGMEGRFPRWQNVIPEGDKAAVVTFPSAAYALTGIRQASICCSEESRAVDLTARAGGGVVLNATTAEIGESVVTLADCTVDTTKDSVQISLQGSYFSDALAACTPDDPVTIEIYDHTKPAVVLGERYTCYVMPMSKDR